MHPDWIQRLREVEAGLSENPELRARIGLIFDAGGGLDGAEARAITIELTRHAIRARASGTDVRRRASDILLQWLDMLQACERREVGEHRGFSLSE